MTIISTQLYNEVLEAMDNFQVILIRSSNCIESTTAFFLQENNDTFVSLSSYNFESIEIFPETETSVTNLYEPTNFTPKIQVS